VSADLVAKLSETFAYFLTKLRHFLTKLLKLVVNLVMQQRFAGRQTRFQTRAKGGFHSPHVGAKRAKRLGGEDVHGMNKDSPVDMRTACRSQDLLNVRGMRAAPTGRGHSRIPAGPRCLTE
jgi:hypothetical protein